ncbi:hypothetical protein GCM10009863_56090 [Streptomyces axinellae]|uniref:Uncharacterized protein n=2 Tax=Streptomyces axinellae TaxID=552788 RepID=A0ABP6D807_9ACTN
MQPYEPLRAQNIHLNQGQIPGMRHPRGASPDGSGTPIYDSLYAEWRRLFKALPGDRSGEEELRFEGFGTVHGTGTGAWGGHEPSAASWHTSSWHVPALPPAPRNGHH